jgi:hypothetical protein
MATVVDVHAERPFDLSLVESALSLHVEAVGFTNPVFFVLLAVVHVTGALIKLVR